MHIHRAHNASFRLVANVFKCLGEKNPKLQNCHSVVTVIVVTIYDFFFFFFFWYIDYGLSSDLVKALF